MRNLIKGILFIAITLLCQQGMAQNCTRVIEKQGNGVVSQFLIKSLNKCTVRVKHNSKYPVYRNYFFSNDGHFMVFNSFDDSESSLSTAARNYFVFPRVKNVGWKWNSDSVEILLAQSKIRFDLNEVFYKSGSGISIFEDQNVSPLNKGGVEITNYSGFYLDAGYAHGRLSYENSKSHSVFVDVNGSRCVLLNSNVFDYIYKTVGGRRTLEKVVLKFAPDFNSNGVAQETQLKAFLKHNCSNFSFN